MSVRLSSGEVECPTPDAPEQLGGHGIGDYLLINNAFVEVVRVSDDDLINAFV